MLTFARGILELGIYLDAEPQSNPAMPVVLDGLAAPLRSVILALARRDLLPLFRREAYRYQVMSFRALARRVLIVNDPEEIRNVFVLRSEIYERKSRFMEQALAPVIGDSLFINHGPVWAERRAAIAPLFHTSRIADFHGHFLQAIMETADCWDGERGGPVDVSVAMASATTRAIMLALFGANVQHAAAHKLATMFAAYQEAVEVIDFLYILGLPPWLPSLQRKRTYLAAQAIRSLIADLIATAEREQGQGIFRALVSVRRPDGTPLLDVASRINEVGMVLLAGSETSANVLTWTFYLLSRAPAVLRLCRLELDRVLGNRPPAPEDLGALVFTKAVLQEAMRLYPPVAILSRQAKRADRIRQLIVKPGQTVMAIPWLLHRHKALWRRPHAFLPERFLPHAVPSVGKFSYLPFGLGPRHCVGAAFGMAEMTTFLAVLLRRFDFSLTPGHRVTPRLRLTLRPRGGMPMLIDRR